MSRWIDAAKNNQFLVVFSQFLTAVEEISVDENTPLATVEELARLKKVLIFIDNVINTFDLEMMPANVYANWLPQVQNGLQHTQQFKSSKNIAHLQHANTQADALLTGVRIYMLFPEHGLNAYEAALSAYTEKVILYISSFEQSAKKSQSALSIANGEAAAQKKRIDDIEARVKSFDDYIFLASDENASTESRVKNIVEKIALDYKAVTDLHEKLLNGPESISQKISGYERDINNLLERLSGLNDSAVKSHSELKRFYHRIFGEPIDSSNENGGKGLKNEIDERLQQLSDYEVDHGLRHKAMFEKVESLLPGATSAGLATAYKSLKESFNKPIENYTRAFYGSLVFLLFSGLLMILNFSASPFQIELVKAPDWSEMLRTLLARLPVVIPVVWFAVFSATRRSQYERLQQEYAHKEALASSYEGYKKQLQDLKMEAEDLQKELIAKSINAIAYNASQTLDGKHTERPPILQMLEKLKIEDIKDLVSIAKDKFGIDKVK